MATTRASFSRATSGLRSAKEDPGCTDVSLTAFAFSHASAASGAGLSENQSGAGVRVAPFRPELLLATACRRTGSEFDGITIHLTLVKHSDPPCDSVASRFQTRLFARLVRRVNL